MRERPISVRPVLETDCTRGHVRGNSRLRKAPLARAQSQKQRRTVTLGPDRGSPACAGTSHDLIGPKWVCPLSGRKLEKSRSRVGHFRVTVPAISLLSIIAVCMGHEMSFHRLQLQFADVESRHMRAGGKRGAQFFANPRPRLWCFRYPDWAGLGCRAE